MMMVILSCIFFGETVWYEQIKNVNKIFVSKFQIKKGKEIVGTTKHVRVNRCIKIPPRCLQML